MKTLSGPAADCESIAGGLLNQPVNAISSLAFVIGGGLALAAIRRHGHSKREPRRSVAVVMILTGIGSGAFHGFGGTFATWLHDASLAGLLLLLVGIETTRRTLRPWNTNQWWAALAGSAALVGLFPKAAAPSAAIGAAVAVLLGVMPGRWSRPGSEAAVEGFRTGLLVPLAVLTAGAIIFALSRTGGPLCRPDSPIQGHGLWHILAAAGLAVYTLRIGSSEQAVKAL